MTRFGDPVANLVAAIGDDPFAGRLIGLLRTRLPFRAATVFVHRRGAGPLHLFDDFEGEAARKGVGEYLERTYVLNPFYQAHLAGLASGIYRVRDLAPDVFFESAHYRRFRVTFSDEEEAGYLTEHWPRGLAEIDVAVALPFGETAEIALYRTRHEPPFADPEIADLGIALDVIQACFELHWARRRDGHGRAEAPSVRDADRASAFGAGIITARERQIVAMILQGHSSQSVARTLRVSIETVRSHRKNAYGKLGVSTQAELLAIFLRHLDVGAGTPFERRS